MGDCDSRPSTDDMGKSGPLSVSMPGTICEESFLFFVEDVVKASSLCRSRFVDGRRIQSVVRKHRRFRNATV